MLPNEVDQPGTANLLYLVISAYSLRNGNEAVRVPFKDCKSSPKKASGLLEYSYTWAILQQLSNLFLWD